VIGGGAALGWGLVSWIIATVRQQRAPPVPMGAQIRAAPTAAAAPHGRISLAELGRTWHVILGVREDASLGEIEAAYREGVAECERGAAAGDATLAARSRLDEALDFVRTLRKQPPGKPGSV
jgi:acyl transferase domain-containing protein